MVRKAIALTLIIFVLILPPVFATVVYLYSDPGDIPLYQAVSKEEDVVLNGRGNVILALDLNYKFLNESGRQKVLDLLKEAKDGKTVVVGLNTLRTMEKERPGVFDLLGIDVNFTQLGLVKILPNNKLKFTPFTYDSDIYGIVIVRGMVKHVLISEGIPIVSELSLGKGKLVIVAINPTALYLDTQNPAIVEFVVALIKYYKGGISIGELIVGVLALTSVIAYTLRSNNSSLKKFMISWKGLLLVIGGFMLPIKNVLKNEIRKSIYQYITEKGYTTINDVALAFSMSRTNARWHLSVLKRSGYIDETKIGNTRLFYPVGKKKKAVRSFLLESRTRREILKMLWEGKSLSEISRVLGLSKSTVHYNLRILEEYGLVKAKGRGKYEVVKEDT